MAAIHVWPQHSGRPHFGGWRRHCGCLFPERIMVRAVVRPQLQRRLHAGSMAENRGCALPNPLLH